MLFSAVLVQQPHLSFPAFHSSFCLHLYLFFVLFCMATKVLLCFSICLSIQCFALFFLKTSNFFNLSPIAVAAVCFTKSSFSTGQFVIFQNYFAVVFAVFVSKFNYHRQAQFDTFSADATVGISILNRKANRSFISISRAFLICFSCFLFLILPFFCFPFRCTLYLWQCFR